MIEIDKSIISTNELMEKLQLTINKYSIPQTVLKTEEDTAEVSSKLLLNYSIINESLAQLSANIKQLNETWYIQDQYITSNKKVIGGFIVLVKRFIRKCTYWLIKPYVNQQIAFNGAATRAICDMKKIQDQILIALKSDNQ